MVDGIGRSSLAREAIQAALRMQAEAARKIESKVAQNLAADAIAPSAAERTASFGQTLSQGLAEVNSGVNAVDQLPVEMVSGRIRDFHEVAVQIKQSELAFKFALEVRNKLIEAYRETMRMNV